MASCPSFPALCFVPASCSKLSCLQLIGTRGRHDGATRGTASGASWETWTSGILSCLEMKLPWAGALGGTLLPRRLQKHQNYSTMPPSPRRKSSTRAVNGRFAAHFGCADTLAKEGSRPAPCPSASGTTCHGNNAPGPSVASSPIADAGLCQRTCQLSCWLRQRCRAVKCTAFTG